MVEPREWFTALLQQPEKGRARSLPQPNRFRTISRLVFLNRSPTLFRLVCTLLVVSLFALAAGCTPKAAEVKMAPVKGTVKLDGKPMAEGEVTFGITGEVPTTMPVVNGSFSGQAGHGTNRVQIMAYRKGTPVKMGDQEFGGEKENYIPSKYNTESKMTAEVTAGGANDFTFEATSN
jgi:hypothetical protein